MNNSSLNASHHVLAGANEQTFHAMSRVLTNLVDTQNCMVSNFQQISAQIESLRVEVRTSISDLRSDIQRSEDKYVDGLSKSHEKEVDRLMRLVENMNITGQHDQAPQRQNMNDSLQIMMLQQALQQQQQHMAAYRVPPSMVAPQPQHPVIAAMLQQQHQTISPMAQMMPMTPQPAVNPLFQQPTMVAPSPSINRAGQSPSTASSSSPVVTAAAPVLPKPALSFATPPATFKPATPKPAEAVVTTTPNAVKPATLTFGNIFGAAPKPPMPTTPQAVVSSPKKEPEQAVREDEEGDPEEYVPEADFAPAIPLPDLVDVVTGEEDETPLFTTRCKVYRFTDNEWKERGIGELKVLENKDTKKRRIVMRREQVHKVCVNHGFDASMKIEPMRNQPKALCWVCMDASDGESTVTKLSARFASPELAAEFRTVFEAAVENAKNYASPQKPVDIKDEPKSEPAEEVVIPRNEPAAQPAGFDWKAPTGSWDCAGCYSNNPASAAKCNCCGTGKDGSAPEPELPKTTFNQPATGVSFGFKNAAPTFGFSSSAAAAEQPKPITPIFGAAKPLEQPTTPNFTFASKPAAEPVAAPAQPAKLSFSDAAKAAASDAPSPSVGFSFGKPATLAATTVAPAPGTPTFSFKSAAAPQKTLFGGSAFGSSSPGGSIFGGAVKTPTTTGPSAETTATSHVFGQGTSLGGTSGFSFSSAAPKGNIFEGTTSESAKQKLNALEKAKPLNTSMASSGPGNQNKDDDEEGGEDDEYEAQADFQPIVPLPDLIEVKTGEEEEEVVFKERCKLYRYDKEAREAKERGVGEIKILRNSNGLYRCVMRREQVHKLCANFLIRAGMTITEKDKSEQVALLNCRDFSEDAGGREETLFIKFKSSVERDAFIATYREGIASDS